MTTVSILLTRGLSFILVCETDRLVLSSGGGVLHVNEKNSTSRLRTFFLDPPGQGEKARARLGAAMLVFILGAAHWILMFNCGGMALFSHDWVKEAAYLGTLRDAVTQWVVPWQWDRECFHAGIRNFLGNPEVCLTPDVLLLRWFGDGPFIVFHILLMYGVGCAGLFALARRRGLSFMALIFLWMLFFFNGHVVSHLAVGHFQWTGCFLLPLFLMFFERLTGAPPEDRRLDARAVAWMGLVLGTLFFNGSLHVACWCLLFMAAGAAFRPRRAPGLALAAALGVMAGSARLLPAFVTFENLHNDFLGGYPAPGTLLAAFTRIRTVENPLNPHGAAVGWWEYDLYLGYAGFAALIFGFVYALARRPQAHRSALLGPMAVMFVLSLGGLWGLIAGSGLPFVSVERMPSRFMIMAAMGAMVIAAGGLDTAARHWPKLFGRVAAIIAPLIALSLTWHTYLWRISRLEGLSNPVFIPKLHIVPNADPVYAMAVYAGWWISVVALIAVAVFLIGVQRRKNT